MVGAAAFFAPVLVQVALTLTLLVWAGQVRVTAVRSGAVRAGEVALGQPNWPTKVTQVTNAYENQLELPVLFYLVAILTYFTGLATITLVVLAWAFVATRVLHATVHVTTNNLVRRFFAFAAGFAILTAMWVLFALELFFGL